MAQQRGNGGIKNPYPLSSMPLLGCILQRGQEDQPMPFTEASISQHRQSRKQQEMDLEGREDNHWHNLSSSPFSKQFLLLSDVKLSIPSTRKLSLHQPLYPDGMLST